MSSRTAPRLILALFALVGCSAAPGSEQTADEPAGELRLGLELGNSGVQSVDYVITGSAGFSKVGSIDVSKSSTIAARIGALPVASGYSIVLSAEATEPPATCTGSAGFDVTAGETTPVDVSLQCVEVNAEFNTCPVIDDLSALPNQVALGGAITLNASVHDSDSGPQPVSHTWTTTSGALTSSGANATLTCSSAGVATVTLSIDDGGADCASSQSVLVTCGEPAAVEPQPAPVSTPFVLLLAAQLLGFGAYRSGRGRKSSRSSATAT
jgi:hypothetical protein